MKPIVLVGRKFYLSLGEAAEAASVKADHIERLCKKGRLDGKVIEGSWYVALDSLRDYLDLQELTHAFIPERKSSSFQSSSSPLISVAHVDQGLSQQEVAIIQSNTTVYCSDSVSTKADGKTFISYFIVTPQARMLLLVLALGFIFIGGDYIVRAPQTKSMLTFAQEQTLRVQTSARSLMEMAGDRFISGALSLQKSAHYTRTFLQRQIDDGKNILVAGEDSLGVWALEGIRLTRLKMGVLGQLAHNSVLKIGLALNDGLVSVGDAVAGAAGFLWEMRNTD